MSYTQRSQKKSLSFGKKKQLNPSSITKIQSIQKYKQSNSKSTNILSLSYQKQQYSFEDLFMLINKQSKLFPQYSSLDKQNIDSYNLESMTPAQAIKQLTKRLVNQKQKNGLLNQQIFAKDNNIKQKNRQVDQLEKTNDLLNAKIKQLNEEIVFWREGHQRMLHSIQNSKQQEIQFLPSFSKSNKLKQLKESIKQDRKNQKIKSTKIISSGTKLNPTRTQTPQVNKPFQDCQIQTDYVRSIIFDLDNISVCESFDDNPFQGVVIQANNQLRQDLRQAQDHIHQLQAKINILDQKIKQQRDLFKIQKQREFTLLRERFSLFLNDYHNFRIIYSQLRTQNSALKKVVPHDQFNLSIIPIKFDL